MAFLKALWDWPCILSDTVIDKVCVISSWFGGFAFVYFLIRSNASIDQACDAARELVRSFELPWLFSTPPLCFEFL
jgi:hypothetical protein